jgi:hypothetical protein
MACLDWMGQAVFYWEKVLARTVRTGRAEHLAEEKGFAGGFWIA